MHLHKTESEPSLQARGRVGDSHSASRGRGDVVLEPETGEQLTNPRGNLSLSSTLCW